MFSKRPKSLVRLWVEIMERSQVLQWVSGGGTGTPHRWDDPSTEAVQRKQRLHPRVDPRDITQAPLLPHRICKNCKRQHWILYQFWNKELNQCYPNLQCLRLGWEGSHAVPVRFWFDTCVTEYERAYFFLRNFIFMFLNIFICFKPKQNEKINTQKTPVHPVHPTPCSLALFVTICFNSLLLQCLCKIEYIFSFSYLTH